MAIISIDAMGGDRGISATVPAAIASLKKHADLEIVLVGDERLLLRALRKCKADKHPRIRIQHASEVVAMDESPALALRGKKDSSMRVAINLVKEGDAHAAVSAGNTGALMATARFVLKTLPGIDRPAIIYALPAYDRANDCMTSVHMLDLGANIDCTPKHLFEFAIMGASLTEAVDGLSKPRVALLNIGQEEIKGLESIKQTAKLLQDESAINYIGFIEGNDIFSAKADVVVCDGFVGNVALKTTEGVATLLGTMLKRSLLNTFMGRIAGVLAIPMLLRLKKKFDIRHYNGASFLGLKGIVVKSHGGADRIAFSTAIDEAVKEIEKDIPALIHARVGALLGGDS